MSFIESLRVNSKPIKSPFFMVLWGTAGVGKSGMCLSAPDPFYVSLEAGTEWLPAQKFVDDNEKPIIPKSIDEVFLMLKWLLKAENREALEKPVKTIIIDSLGFFEELNYKDVIAKNPMTEGKSPKPVTSIVDLAFDGMALAMANWHKLLAAVDAFKKHNINVIMITHSQYINVTSPDGKSYKELGFALQAYGKHNVQELITRACDYCYFMASETEVVTVGKGTWTKNVAIGTRTSNTIVSTRKTPLFFAKTRAMDETKIPDCYIYDLDSRSEVQKQIFNDILTA